MIELTVTKTSENPSVFTLSPSAIEIGGKDSSLIDSIHVNIPPEWQGKVIRVTFNQSALYGGNIIPKFPNADGIIELKNDVTLCSGDLVIDAVGVDGSVSPSTGCHYTIYSHPKFGGTEQDVIPSEYQQFVAETKGYSDSAQASATVANASKEAAALSEQNSKTSETTSLAAQEEAENAKAAAQGSAEAAAQSEVNSKTSEEHSAQSEANSKTSETNSKTSETNSANSAAAAAGSATAANASKTAAETASNAAQAANIVNPQSWTDAQKLTARTNIEAVPYIGATSDIDIGSHNFKASGFIGSGTDGSINIISPEITVSSKNKYIGILSSPSTGLIMQNQTYVWNGTNYISSNGFFVGTNAGVYNIGGDSNGFGYTALYNNTGSKSNGFGNQALYNNTGSNSNGFGHTALQNNTGASCNGFGYTALHNNTGSYSNGFGYQALYNNIGGDSNGFGYTALQNNIGSSCNGVGFAALYNNTGGDSNGFGYETLRYNQKSNNVAVGNGAYSNFLENPASDKAIDYTAVDVTTNRITISNHGFGTAGSFINIKYQSTTGTPIGGLFAGGIYQVKIIDSDTLEFLTNGRGVSLTSQGTGSHTFRAQFAYGNTITIGNGISPNKDNQAVIGDPSVLEFVLGGALVVGKDYLKIASPKTPASPTDTGITGQICYDSNYLYVCTATNTWKRIALTTW